MAQPTRLSNRSPQKSTPKSRNPLDYNPLFSFFQHSCGLPPRQAESLPPSRFSLDSFAETKRITKSISAEMRGQEAISAPQRILLVVCTVRRFIHNRHSRMAWPRLSDRQQRWVYSLPSRNRHTTMTPAQPAVTVSLRVEDIAASVGSAYAVQCVEQHLGERTTAKTAARASNPNRV